MNINRVVLTGNLTRDPELRQTPSGLAICKLGVACNTRVKQNGEWIDKPNYFTVTVFGSQGENVQRFLAKGRPVAIDGRLDWHSWEQDGQKREAVEIIADSVQFLSDGQQRNGESSGGSSSSGFNTAPPVSAPPPVSAATTADDDIPF